MSDRKEGMLARLIIALCLLTALLPGMSRPMLQMGGRC